jgi:hypothetical protein
VAAALQHRLPDAEALAAPLAAAEHVEPRVGARARRDLLARPVVAVRGHEYLVARSAAREVGLDAVERALDASRLVVGRHHDAERRAVCELLQA